MDFFWVSGIKDDATVWPEIFRLVVAIGVSALSAYGFLKGFSKFAKASILQDIKGDLDKHYAPKVEVDYALRATNEAIMMVRRATTEVEVQAEQQAQELGVKIEDITTTVIEQHEMTTTIRESQIRLEEGYVGLTSDVRALQALQVQQREDYRELRVSYTEMSADVAALREATNHLRDGQQNLLEAIREVSRKLEGR